MLSFYLKGLKKILSALKKIFIVVTVFFAVISLFMYFINQDKQKLNMSKVDPVKKNREEIYKVIKDPEMNKTKEGKLAIAVYRTMMCTMVGESCTDNPADGDKRFQSSIFGYMSKLLAMPYSRAPASGISWVYNGLADSGFITKSFAAQGIGFAAISPLQPIWKIFRDVSYVFLVLVLVAIGFMIMFRMKINPQTVISVENALPKIIISLLLITFSFPIAGFLIDLMYILIAISIYILSQLNEGILTPGNMSTLQNDYIGAGFSRLWPLGDFRTGWDAGFAMFQILPDILQGIIKLIIAPVIVLGLSHLKLKPITTAVSSLHGIGATLFGQAVGTGGGAGVNIGGLPGLISAALFLIVSAVLANFAPGIFLAIMIWLTLFLLLFRLLVVVLVFLDMRLDGGL